jgi:iron complex outermembrane recepter protein
MGPFSAYLSVVHNYKRGDIRNDGAGQIWNRTNSADSRSAKILASPAWLGTKDAMSYFAAVKFESGDFTTVYKFDHADDEGTPEGTGFVGYGANVPLIGGLLDALITSQPRPVLMTTDGKRPKAVSNSWTIPTTQTVEGHSLTSTWQAGDNLSLKNVFGYRKSYLFTASALDGFSGLTITPQAIPSLATLIAFSTLPPAQAGAAIPGIAASLAPLVGSPFLGLASQPENRSEQISDELQLNYFSDFVTATAGLLWFKSKDWTGEGLLQNTVSFSPIPFGVLPNTNIGRSYNKAESLAAYAQLEFRVTLPAGVSRGTTSRAASHTARPLRR